MVMGGIGAQPPYKGTGGRPWGRPYRGRGPGDSPLAQP